jgi:hypothetical protein
MLHMLYVQNLLNGQYCIIEGHGVCPTHHR